MFIQFHRWHETAWLKPAGVLNPRTKIFMGVSGYPGCDRVAAHQMSHVRAESPLRWRAGSCMAIPTGGGFENAPPFGGGVVGAARLAQPVEHAIASRAR